MRPLKVTERLQIPPAEIVASALRRRWIRSLLEVGCGIGGIVAQFNGIPIRVGVDVNDAELEVARNNHSAITFLHVDITRLRDYFIPFSFAAVFASDVLEHFEKETSNDILRQMEEVASVFSIVWSPLGRAGMDDFNKTCEEEESLLRHRCIITEEEFADRGYMTMVFPSYWNRYYRDEWTADGLLAIKEMGV